MRNIIATTIAPAASVATHSVVASLPDPNTIQESAGLIVQILLAITALLGLFKRPKA